MKKLIVFLMPLLCTSCYYEDADVVLFTSSYYLSNKTGRTLEVYMGEKFYGFAKDQWSVWLYTQSSYNFDEVSMERLMIEHPESFKDISIYDVTDGDRVFLKTWTFAERDQDGKQFYDLSDCDLFVCDHRDVPPTELLYDYVFTVYPADVGL